MIMKRILFSTVGLRSLGAVLLVCFMAVASFGQSVGDFRSKNTTGTWATISDWETYDGAAWNTAVAIPSGTGAVEIQLGHTMTVGVGLTLTNPVIVKGTLSNGFTITINGGSLTYKSGSFYIHTPANIAIPVSTWETGSTCKITGVTSSLSNVSTSIPLQLTNLYNLVWDCSGQTSNLNLLSNGNLTINGNLTVNGTGAASKLRFTSIVASATQTVTIKGNVNVVKTGASIASLESSGSGVTGATMNVNIDGNVNLDGGVLSLSGATGITGNWTVKGDFTMATTTGTLLTRSSGSTGSTLFFGKSGTQIFTNTTASFITNGVIGVVNNGATLEMGPNTFFDGSGGFTVASGGGLRIGSSAGITSSGATGNVRSTTRTFSTMGNYAYTGTAAQVTGSGLPATVNTLTINNAAGVTLSAATTVTGALTLTSGNLTLNSNALTMASGSMVKGTGTIIGNFTHPAGSTLAPGASPGTVTINGDFTNIGDWDIEIGGATAGTEHDQVLATGIATLTGGTVNVTLINGYNPPLGASFIILDAASLTGTFAAINLPPLSGGKTWSASPTYDLVAGTATITVSSVLSTELISFIAKANGSVNTLAWATASEKNNKEFQIERSTNGSNFTSIGTVKGSGTTSSATNYNFNDEGSLSISYYRVRSVDFDGKTEVSNIVSVVRSATGKLQVYPSVATDKIIVNTDNTNLEVYTIVNLLGRTVQTGTLTGQKELSVSALATGAYWLKVGNEVVKFVKN